MSLVDRVRAALDDWGQLREIEMFGGVVFEWDGDPLVGVVDGELIVRVPSGWETAAGDLDELIRRAADVVIAECVVRWHAQLRAGGDDAPRAMLALAHHDPEREQLQRILLDHIGHPRLGQLAMTCLGHVARIDGEVLPEVLPRLEELGVVAEDARDEVERCVNPFRLWVPGTPWVIFAPPGDAEVARQRALLRSAGTEGDRVVVIENAEALPSLLPFVRKLCDEGYEQPDAPHFVLEFDGDIGALESQLHDDEYSARFDPPYLMVW